MYARVKINAGSHHLKGTNGFLAHVYGFGERESYAYSCGSSTVARGVSFNGTPLLVDTINKEHFCVGTELNMRLNVGSNDFQSVFWDFGDGITYSPDALATDEEKSSAKHTYNTPGWYDLVITINYADQQRCRGMQHEQTETIKISFLVVGAGLRLDRDRQAPGAQEIVVRIFRNGARRSGHQRDGIYDLARCDMEAPGR